MHSLTFSVVPVELRIGWASVCAVGWNAIISDQNQAAIQRADAPADCKADKEANTSARFVVASVEFVYTRL